MVTVFISCISYTQVIFLKLKKKRILKATGIFAQRKYKYIYIYIYIMFIISYKLFIKLS